MKSDSEGEYFICDRDEEDRPRIRTGDWAWFDRELQKFFERHKGYKILVSEIRESPAGNA